MDKDWMLPDDFIMPKIGDFLRRDYYDTDHNLYQVLDIEPYNENGGLPYIIKNLTKNQIKQIHANSGTGFEEFVILTEEESKEKLSLLKNSIDNLKNSYPNLEDYCMFNNVTSTHLYHLFQVTDILEKLDFGYVKHTFKNLVNGKSYLCYSSYSGFNNSYRAITKEEANRKLKELVFK